MPPDLPSAPASQLHRILCEFEAAGIRPTALAVLSKATDDGLTDQEITELVDQLATTRGLDEVRA